VKKDTEPSLRDRLTITLHEGQRDALEAIAARNRASMAFVVRYALDRFIEENRDEQLKLFHP
jgi:hypothetical protein